jgi:hypothetical protein
MIEHQYFIAEAAGPAAHYLAALVPAVHGDDQRVDLLKVIADVAWGAGLRLAEVRDAYRDGLPAVPDGHGSQSSDDDDAEDSSATEQSIVDPVWDEVCGSVSAATALWASLAASPHAEVRRWAVVLLGFAIGEEAAVALRQRAEAETDPMTRAEALAGLGLHRDTRPTRELLARQIAAVADDPLGGFCAALSWLRIGAQPAGPAVEVILGMLRGEVKPAGFGRLYLVAGEPVYDAATALSLLRPEQVAPHLARLGAALDEVSAREAVKVARALLEIVFPEGDDEDEPLTSPQRQVIAAIAASDKAWRFDAEMTGILRHNDLPIRRDELQALADGTAGRETTAGTGRRRRRRGNPANVN